MSDYQPDRDAENVYPQTQENPVTEQENPAVSKLREAFDTARNAIIEGSELAKLVVELRSQVNGLGIEVGSLQRDLEYIRNRNRELDEQVTQVREARDRALADVATQRHRADTNESEQYKSQEIITRLREELAYTARDLDNAKKTRDDAEYKAIELEDKLKIAEAKLAQMQAIICPVVEPVKAEQPRAEDGQFRPYESGSQSPSSGF